MKKQNELLLWLNRKHLSHVDALKLAIKAWNSIDYTNLSKYETIVGYFCEKLPLLCCVEQEVPEGSGEDDLWGTIREFVELKYPVGVVSVEARIRLIECLVEHVNVTKSGGLREFLILKSTLENPFFVSFFSANVSTYGKLMGKCLVAWREVLERNPIQGGLEGVEKQITEDLLRNLQEFSQYQANNVEFAKVFKQEIHQKIIEMVIYLQSRKISWKRKLFAIYQALFFSEDSGKGYRMDFEASGKGEKLADDRISFQNPELYVVLMEIEGFLFAYSTQQKDLCSSFIDYLLRDLFVEEKMNLSNIVLGMSHLMLLLKSYSIRLGGEDKSFHSLRRRILEIVEEFAERNTQECLSLTLRTLQLHPLLLEEDLTSLIVKFLFLPKNEASLEVFGHFFALSLETFFKLSRFEKILNRLLENIVSVATSMEFPKKLKRKLKEKSQSPQKRQKITNSGDFVEILTKKSAGNPEKLAQDEWSEISFAWSDGFSKRFSRIVLNLTPNVSLQVWKSLMFYVQGALDTAKERNFDENSLFCIDFFVKIFSAYIRGCRLLERPDNVVTKIDERRLLTKDLLRNFLKLLQEAEESILERPLKAFLELLGFVLDFETTIIVYRPDFLNDSTSESFQKINYMDQNEWDQILSRCKGESLQNLANSINFKFLKLNHVEKKTPESLPEDLQRILKDPQEFQKLIVHDKDGLWLQKLLSREQKSLLAGLFAENLELLSCSNGLETLEDAEFLSLLALKILDQISKKINSKKSPFCKINFDKVISGDESTEEIPERILHQTKTVSLKEKVSSDDLLQLLQALKLLPVAFLSKDVKNQFLFFLIVLLHSLADFDDLQTILLDTLTNLVELGTGVDVFKYAGISKIKELFPSTSDNRRLYEVLLAGASKHQSASNIGSFKDLQRILEENVEADYQDICLIALEAIAKTKNKEIIAIRSSLTTFALKYFKKAPVTDDLLRSFTATLTAYFSSKERPDEDKKLGSIALKYINHFKDSQKSEIVDLLRIVTDHKDDLKITSASLTPLILEFWNQLKKTNEAAESTEIASIVVKFCTDEEFSKFLENFREEVKTVDPIYVCKTLQNLGSSMSEEKGEVFSKFYEEILFEITAKLIPKEAVEDSLLLMLNILKCHSVIIKNKKIPLPNSLFQDILTFLVEINLKRLKVNLEDFTKLHLQMTDLCYVINQHRSSCLRFAMPQFVSIFKNLVHGICGYRSDMGKKEKLEQEEVEALTGLSHKLEIMIAFMASANKNARRVAPFMLVYVINEMIYNQNPTTLNPSIKTHINNIC
uniref:Nucleolar 27S pre-rRNA processing Urb2/Npa2 C-terminal domain-containing protein n=1 Tax=Lutzomyia longipalpis TaxID=7200 RepID=A0A1B0CKH0_LUTLO